MEKEYKELKIIKNVKMGDVPIKKFTTRMIDYDSIETLFEIEQVLPLVEGSYLTLNKLDYEVEYIDYNLDNRTIDVIVYKA